MARRTRADVTGWSTLPAPALALLMVLMLLVPWPVLAGHPGGEGARPGGCANAIDAPVPLERGPLAQVGFLENGGQLGDICVRYYSWSSSGGVALMDGGIAITLFDEASGAGCTVRLSFEGARGSAPVGRDPLPGATNYILGADPSKWAQGLKTYREVAYEGLWEGIDLVYRLDGWGLKYELHLAPGADLDEATFSLRGHQGLRVDASGGLVVSTPGGELRDSAPLSFYSDGYGEVVPSSFRLMDGSSYGLEAGPRDPTRPLVVDPLVFSTFVGGSMGLLETPYAGVKVDSSGRPVVAGYLNTTDFPTTPGAFMTGPGGGDWDAFVLRLSSDGGDLEWSTYVGGSRSDLAYSLDLDDQDRPVIVGRTNSTDFPTTAGAFDEGHQGSDVEGFVMKLAADGGSPVLSTYLGGNSTDELVGLTLDAQGRILVLGNTMSPDLPSTPSAIQVNHSGRSFDLFLAQLSSDGSSLGWLTYLGGDLWDVGYGIAVDGGGAALVVGETTSSDFPTTNGSYQTFLAGKTDAFVARVAQDGSNLSFATLVGGMEDDTAEHVVAMANGSIVVAGYTMSPQFPTTNGSFDRTHNGSADAFLLRLDRGGARMGFSTLLGGNGWDSCSGLEVDANGTAYLAGQTLSSDFPTMKGAQQERPLGGTEAFLACLAENGTVQAYGTYLGGRRDDEATGLALLPDGDVMLVGGTDSTDFPTLPGAYQGAHGGKVDVFVARLDLYLDREGPVAVPGPDVVVDQHTVVTLDGSNSTDNVGVINWTWTFDYNGSQVTLYGPVISWTFDLAGKYYVTLRVRDAVGLEDEMWVSVFVRDTEPPEAALQDDMYGVQGWRVLLDGTGSTDNVGIAHYNWTVELGGVVTNLTGPQVEHLFSEAGEHLVTLSVDDQAGNSDVASFRVFIADITSPTAEAGPDVTVDQGAMVIFDARGSTDNVGIENHTWVFTYAGAQILLFGEEASFTFDRAGAYDVDLYVRDLAGNQAQDRLRVVVRDTTPPVARTRADVTIDQGETVALDATGSTDNVGIMSWRWQVSFGGHDTNFSGASTSFTFAAAGVHTVTLNVSDAAGNWDLAGFKVTVRDITAPTAHAGEDSVIGVGETVHFNGSASSDNVAVVSWTWTLTDGAQLVTLQGPTPEHTFQRVGTYVASLRVVDSSGLYDEDQVEVVVLDTVPPVADAGPSVEIRPGDTVSFNGTNSTDNVAIAGYVWTFDYRQGPVELEGPSQQFTFELLGNYLVTLTVTDTSGNWANSTLTVSVLPEEEDGNGGGDGEDQSWLVYLLVAAAACIIVTIALMALSRRAARTPDDMGWRPSDDELRERAEDVRKDKEDEGGKGEERERGKAEGKVEESEAEVTEVEGNAPPGRGPGG